MEGINIIDKLAWIHIVDRKVLSSRSRGKTVFYLPGGKREARESDADALMREVREELSVSLVAETIEYIGTFRAQAHGYAAGILVNMTCYAADYEGSLKASGEVEEIQWLTYKDQERSSMVDKLILHWLYEKGRIAP